ncbi:MAG: tyrosine-type recombinase/integrase [Armatimonadetes bacterium]|nr:tyrosine-type recombinase/integrase [Armatimonadota bacterium]
MATRADSKDGSCREVLTGKHKGKWRVQYTVETPTGHRQRLSRIFSTKTEGKDFLRSLQRGTKVEAARQARELTLEEWFLWLAENDWPESLAAVTIEQRKRRFRKYTKRHFGNTPLSKIDPMKVRAYYRELRANGAKETLVISVRADLVRAFNQAIVPYGRIPMTMANPFRLSVPQPVTREAVALAPDEVKRGIASKKLDSSRRALLAILLLGGLRLGEMMAMQVSKLRFEDNLIVIDSAVLVAFGGKQSIGLPKGGKTRNVVMCQWLKAILMDHVQGMAPDAFLWPKATLNEPRMKKQVYEVWKSILDDSGLPNDMSPHDCRLTHINIIEKLMPEVSQTTMKEHIGHAASGVTEANYTRPLTAAQSILRESLDRVFG